MHTALFKVYNWSEEFEQTGPACISLKGPVGCRPAVKGWDMYIDSSVPQHNHLSQGQNQATLSFTSLL